MSKSNMEIIARVMALFACLCCALALAFMPFVRIAKMRGEMQTQAEQVRSLTAFYSFP